MNLLLHRRADRNIKIGTNIYMYTSELPAYSLKTELIWQRDLRHKRLLSAIVSPARTSFYLPQQDSVHVFISNLMKWAYYGGNQ